MINIARFYFIADALNGTGGFQNTIFNNDSSDNSYLIRYPREGDDKYLKRKNIAWYIKNLRLVCTQFVGYLNKKLPYRELPNPVFKEFADNCDGKGNSLNNFFSNFSIDAKARGSMLLLVDKNADGSGLPYLVAIPPEKVLEYKHQQNGVLSYILIQDGDNQRGWDENRWWIKTQTGTITGEHNLGTCPILTFAEHEFPNEGEFSQIADISRRLFNLYSELDEILRSQTFSILTYQIPPEQLLTTQVEGLSSQLGTHNILIHSGDTPVFIAPPDGPANVYLETIKTMEAKIRQIGYVIETTNVINESGIALTIRFQQLNAALSLWANRMNNLERKMWDLVALWQGMQNSTTVVWEKDYAITDLTAELNTLASMQASGFSNQALAAKRKQILQLALGNLPIEELNILILEEDSIKNEVAIDVGSNNP